MIYKWSYLYLYTLRLSYEAYKKYMNRALYLQGNDVNRLITKTIFKKTKLVVILSQNKTMSS